MKKLALATAVVMLVAVAMLVQPIGASGPLIDESGFLCAVTDANGSVVFTTASHFVVFSSGKAVLTCTAGGPAPKKAFNWTYAKLPLLCGSPLGSFTTDWKNRIAANGDISLQCNFDAVTPTLARTSGGAAGLG